MKTKWYISTLIIVFTLLGIYHTNNALPNQEIVVKFNDDKVTNDQSQHAIASIKQQLQDFGIHHIQVRQVNSRDFRIVYHSSVTVESIKKSLVSNENLSRDVASFGLNHKQSPGSNQKHYNLDVYEIQGISVNYDLTGTLTLETKYVYDPFVHSNVYSNVDGINVNTDNEPLESVFKCYKDIAIAMENTSRTIPEVRAGPNDFTGIL